MVRDSAPAPIGSRCSDRRGVLNARHRESYDLLAPDYAQRNREMPADVVVSAEQFAALAGAGPVLDLGCGHGRDLAWFEQKGIAVVGADLSAGMLAQAQGRTVSPLIQLDMRRTAFQSAAFWGVWSDAAIVHLPKDDLPALLLEISRVLTPGGVFFAAVQVGEGEAWETWECYPFTRRFFARYSCAEFAAILKHAGFLVQSQSDRRISPRRHWAHYLALRDAGS